MISRPGLLPISAVQELKRFALPFAIYSALLAAGAITSADVVNPDAICYARNAQYIAGARFLDSASGCWSPLISWCAVPLVSAGVEALTALRVVLAVWGFLFIAACAVLLRAFGRPRMAAEITILSLVSILAAYGATRIITPDVIASACLIAYSANTLSPALFTRNSRAVLCGFLGGVSFLAKAYAFPFVVAHFALVCLMHWLPRRTELPARKVVVKWLFGMVAFGLVSAPWIGLLTYKYGEITFSTAGRINRAIIGPNSPSAESHPTFRGLHTPPAGRISVWEVPETTHYSYWSPFESRAYFCYQARLVAQTGWRMLRRIQDFDVLRITLLAFLVLPVVCYRTPAFFPCAWTTATVALYVSGLLLVHFQERYFLFYLWPICCVYCLGFGYDVLCKYGEKAAIPRRILVCVAVIAVASFAGRTVEFASNVIWPDDEGKFIYRAIANGLHEGPSAGTIAGTNGNDLYASYLVNRPYLGIPDAKTVGEVESELKEHGARAFLVHSDWELAGTFERSTSWTCVQKIPCGRVSVDVYAPPP